MLMIIGSPPPKELADESWVRVSIREYTPPPDDLIGELPHRRNHLVDYSPALPAEELSNLHFTTGGPYFDDYKNCGYADLWFAERDRMLFANYVPGTHNNDLIGPK